MKILIETTQNVHIEYELASIGERILAYLLDLFIIVSYELTAWTALQELGIDSTVSQVLVLSIPFLLYELLCEILLDGRTVGKIALKIKVISLTGRQPALSSYLLRWLLRPIDFGISMGGIAIMSIILNGKGQRLGDLVANTSVISTKERVKKTNTLFPKIDESYEPLYPQVIKLTDEEVNLVKEVVIDYQKSRQSKPLQLLAKKVQDFLEIETEERPLHFLKSVVKDYHHLTATGWK